ncbi:DUF86 domain-containing protein [Paenibacillus alkaliterrae]|uniref:type VII toxin-antitoxin system HepT family RNase toxin n=1 Tax=Paenibacillus alkaliterrae TaxID=320909 RepID=UPI001F23A5A9|nr:DUF86 domain-containing protein [Paenibacillus alkaliterrae]MCF2941009.1 DUF86 domain-containing protein [Paenibacillus alkaliterrae]
MASEIILNKTDTIERCIRRIHEEYANNEENLLNFTKQDSIILNLQRACEASIDLAMHIVAAKKFGIPQNSRDAFTYLHQNGVIDDSLNQSLKAMVGFRNIAVHDYQAIQIEIVKAIIDKHLSDFILFAKRVQTYMAS